MTRSARPADRTWDDAPSPRPATPGSLPIRLAEIVLRHPVTSGGVAMSLVMIGIIAGNALVNQPERHPHPWFQTRLRAEAKPVPAPTPAPQRTPAAAPTALQSAPAPTAVPTAQPASPPALPRPRPLGAAEQTGTLRDLQAALRDHGLYSGALDGVLGPATTEAIKAFERRIGAPVTGEPSDLLLATARALHPAEPATTASTPQSAQRRAEAYVAQETQVAAVRPAAPIPSAPLAVDTASATTSVGTPSMRVAVADGRTAEPSAAATELAEVDEVEAPVFTGSIRRAAREPLAPGGDGRLQRIQRGLIAAGYGPLKADGRWDDRSASAVRRFEADHGWPVTGRPSNQLASNLPDPGSAHR